MGTSDPRFNANFTRVGESISRLKSFTKANRVDAAFELPPPSPAPMGICFSNKLLPEVEY